MRFVMSSEVETSLSVDRAAIGAMRDSSTSLGMTEFFNKARRRIAFILVLLLLSAFRQPVRGEEPTPPLNVQDHRAEIRAALLRSTPLGSKPRDVLTFIKNRLLQKDDASPLLENHPAIGEAAERSDRRGTKSIRLEVGRYLTHPEVIFLTAPIMMEQEVTAQWAFDEHDRLVEIFVDKKSALY